MNAPSDCPSPTDGAGGSEAETPATPDAPENTPSELPQSSAVVAPAPPARAPRPDPWAHRRAEPRTFAFIWTVFLFLATLSTYAMAMSSGIGGHDVIRPAARMLLALVAAGIVIIWPLVRLSQLPDPRPIAGPILDAVVVLVPIQAIVWPQCAWWLAGWPIEVVAAVGASMASWTAIIGGALSVIHTRRARTVMSPALWMGLILGVLVALHVPVAISTNPVGLDPAAQAVRVTWMLSPVLTVFELTQDRTWTGQPAVVFSGHWRMIGLAAGLAAGLWLTGVALAVRDAGQRQGSGLH